MRLLALSVAAALLGGCADAVDPTLGTDRAFTLYGYLDPTADRQALRVVPIAPTLDADTAATVRATVTSVERSTGRVMEWRDTTITYADASVGYLFVSDYRPTQREAVEVSVRNDVGERDEATVTVEIPPVRQSRISAPPFNLGPVSYFAEVDGVPGVLGGLLRVVVAGPSGEHTLELPLRDSIEEVSPGNWRLGVPFVERVRSFLRGRGLVGDARLASAEVVIYVVDEEWGRARGGLDLDAIVEPGTFTNVQGGFGFVGSGYETSVRWTPSISVQARAGLRVDQDPASQLAINEVSLPQGWVELYNPTPDPISIEGYAIVVNNDEPGVLVRGAVTVGGRSFSVVESGRSLSPGDRVTLNAPNGGAVREFVIGPLTGAEEPSEAYGSFPDGLSLILRDQTDLFRGPVRPTPGAPNELSSRPAVMNEVYTGEGRGWVEVFSQVGQDMRVHVSSSADNVLVGASDFGRAQERFLTVDEGGALDLSRTGTLYLLVEYGDFAFDGETVRRVVDAREIPFGATGTSTGYLPDGSDGTWREGLVPTRGALNTATGRLAKR